MTGPVITSHLEDDFNDALEQRLGRKIQRLPWGSVDIPDNTEILLASPIGKGPHRCYDEHRGSKACSRRGQPPRRKSTRSEEARYRLRWAVESITRAYTDRSIFPPDRITATFFPSWRSRSCINAANAAAPAPSARLWVSV